MEGKPLYDPEGLIKVQVTLGLSKNAISKLDLMKMQLGVNSRSAVVTMLLEEILRESEP